MDGINPTLAFAALFLGLSGHPRDAIESQPDQTLIAQPDDTRSGQAALNFGFGFEDETGWRLPSLEWQVWGPSKCPDAGAVEDGSPGPDVDPGIEDSSHTVLDIVAKPHDATGCFSDRLP